MGRPFAIIGLSMFASLFFMCAFGVTSAYILLGVCALAAAVMLLLKPLRQYKAVLMSACAVVFAATLFCVQYHCSLRPCFAYMNKEVKVCAVLKEYPTYKYEKYYTHLEVKTINGMAVKPFGIRMSTETLEDAEPGDSLNFSTTLYAAGSDSKFSNLNYLSKGIYATCFCAEEPTIEKNEEGFPTVSVLLARYRQSIADALNRLMPQDNAALATAVLIGDRSMISSENLEEITAAGISHIICVSGLHLSILGFGILRFFSLLRISRKIKYCAAGLFIVFFMALCGFASSVVRAGLMFLVFIAAQLFLAEPDSLNSLGFAACVILLNPFNAGNIGFIFSFLATFSIITVGTRLTKLCRQRLDISKQAHWKRALFTVFEIIIISFVVNLFCLPASILIFKKISLIGIVANVLILPFATVLLIASGLAALFGLFGTALTDVAAYPAAFVSSSLCRYILSVCKYLANLPGANIYMYSSLYLVLSVILMAGIGIACLFRRSKVVLCSTAAVLVVSFTAGCFGQMYINAHRLLVSVYSLGSQVCISLQIGKEFTLINAGNHAFTYDKVKESLFAAHLEKIDNFLITGTAKNQCGKARKILNSFEVGKCILPQGSNLDLGKSAQSRTAFKKADWELFQTDSGIELSYYALKFSAVHIRYENQSILFLNTDTADISVLPQRMQSFDILIVATNANNSFSNLKTNAIIEIRKTRDEAHEQELRGTCEHYYATDALSDIQITITKNATKIGSINQWQQ